MCIVDSKFVSERACCALLKEEGKDIVRFCEVVGRMGVCANRDCWEGLQRIFGSFI